MEEVNSPDLAAKFGFFAVYMFQFTMLFTSRRICSDDIMTSGVAQLIGLALTLETSLVWRIHPARKVRNVFFPRSLIQISIRDRVPNVMFFFIVNVSTILLHIDYSISKFTKYYCPAPIDPVSRE